MTPTTSPTTYKIDGKPISTKQSTIFYHKYRLVDSAKKAINTAIAVLETAEAVCSHHLQQTDSTSPAKSLDSVAILGTRRAPSLLNFVVGAFYPLSTIFGRDFHVKLANFLCRVSPRGFVLLNTALEDLGSFVAMLLRPLKVVTVGTMSMSTMMSVTVGVVGAPEKDQGLLLYFRDYTKVSLTLFCNNDRSLREVTMRRMKVLLLESKVHHSRY